MATQVKVYATKQSALLIAHPSAGRVQLGGSNWPMDGFTSRMLSDGLLTQDVTKAYAGPQHPRLKPRDVPVAPPATAKQ
jgi:hypothetical protein